MLSAALIRARPLSTWYILQSWAGNSTDALTPRRLRYRNACDPLGNIAPNVQEPFGVDLSIPEHLHLTSWFAAHRASPSDVGFEASRSFASAARGACLGCYSVLAHRLDVLRCYFCCVSDRRAPGAILAKLGQPHVPDWEANDDCHLTGDCSSDERCRHRAHRAFKHLDDRASALSMVVLGVRAFVAAVTFSRFSF
jgi:hypothetical protein